VISRVLQVAVTPLPGETPGDTYARACAMVAEYDPTFEIDHERTKYYQSNLDGPDQVSDITPLTRNLSVLDMA
jgi:hypothetical protein